MADTEQPDYTSLTVQLLSAYVSNNTIASDELASLIQSTRSALIAETVVEPVETVEYVPAVGIRKSISSREHILSLIDGRPYKTLKRHLASHGLTPTEYRARYGLPESYPMVSQDYSEQRRAVAQKLGLGQRGTQARIAAAAEAAKPAAPKRKSKASAAPASAPTAVEAAPPAPKPATKKAAPTSKAKPAAKEAPVAKPARKPKAAVEGTVQAAPADAPAAVEPVKAKSPTKAPRKKLGIKAEAAS